MKLSDKMKTYVDHKEIQVITEITFTIPQDKKKKVLNQPPRSKHPQVFVHYNLCDICPEIFYIQTLIPTPLDTGGKEKLIVLKWPQTRHFYALFYDRIDHLGLVDHKKVHKTGKKLLF